MRHSNGALITSAAGGAALGAIAIVASALLAVWLTGFLSLFTRNRGLLQLLLAIPVATAAAGFGLGWLGVLSRAQMLWALVPVAILILAGAGAYAGDIRAWPWAAVVGACVLVPWVLGLVAGTAARRGGPKARGPETPRPAPP